MTEAGDQRRVGPIAWVLAGLVRLYQLVVSPWLPPSCRFEPSCSAYALEALRSHGAVRGGWLTIRRLGRCHPFCAGGYDPVPEPRERQRRWLRGGRRLKGGRVGADFPVTGAEQSAEVSAGASISGVPASRTPSSDAGTAPDTATDMTTAPDTTSAPDLMTAPVAATSTVGRSRKSPVASGSPDRGVPAC